MTTNEEDASLMADCQGTQAPFALSSFRAARSCGDVAELFGHLDGDVLRTALMYVRAPEGTALNTGWVRTALKCGVARARRVLLGMRDAGLAVLGSVRDNVTGRFLGRCYVWVGPVATSETTGPGDVRDASRRHSEAGHADPCATAAGRNRGTDVSGTRDADTSTLPALVLGALAGTTLAADGSATGRPAGGESACAPSTGEHPPHQAPTIETLIAEGLHLPSLLWGGFAPGEFLTEPLRASAGPAGPETESSAPESLVAEGHAPESRAPEGLAAESLVPEGLVIGDSAAEGVASGSSVSIGDAAATLQAGASAAERLVPDGVSATHPVPDGLASDGVAAAASALGRRPAGDSVSGTLAVAALAPGSLPAGAFAAERPAADGVSAAGLVPDGVASVGLAAAGPAPDGLAAVVSAPGRRPVGDSLSGTLTVAALAPGSLPVNASAVAARTVQVPTNAVTIHPVPVVKAARTPCAAHKCAGGSHGTDAAREEAPEETDADDSADPKAAALRRRAMGILVGLADVDKRLGFRRDQLAGLIPHVTVLLEVGMEEGALVRLLTVKLPKVGKPLVPGLLQHRLTKQWARFHGVDDTPSAPSDGARPRVPGQRGRRSRRGYPDAERSSRPLIECADCQRPSRSLTTGQLCADCQGRADREREPDDVAVTRARLTALRYGLPE